MYLNLILLLPVFPVNSNIPIKQCDNKFPVNIAEVITQESCSSFTEKFSHFVDIHHLPEFIQDLASAKDIVGQIEFGLSVDAGKVICRNEDAEKPSISPAEIAVDFADKSNQVEIQGNNKQVQQLKIPCSAKKMEEAKCFNNEAHERH